MATLYRRSRASGELDALSLELDGWCSSAALIAYLALSTNLRGRRYLDFATAHAGSAKDYAANCYAVAPDFRHVRRVRPVGMTRRRTSPGSSSYTQNRVEVDGRRPLPPFRLEWANTAANPTSRSTAFSSTPSIDGEPPSRWRW